jgi:hypothetical protein
VGHKLRSTAATARDRRIFLLLFFNRPIFPFRFFLTIRIYEGMSGSANFDSISEFAIRNIVKINRKLRVATEIGSTFFLFLAAS